MQSVPFCCQGISPIRNFQPDEHGIRLVQIQRETDRERETQTDTERDRHTERVGQRDADRYTAGRQPGEDDNASACHGTVRGTPDPTFSVTQATSVVDQENTAASPIAREVTIAALLQEIVPRFYRSGVPALIMILVQCTAGVSACTCTATTRRHDWESVVWRASDRQLREQHAQAGVRRGQFLRPLHGICLALPAAVEKLPSEHRIPVLNYPSLDGQPQSASNKPL